MKRRKVLQILILSSLTFGSYHLINLLWKMRNFMDLNINRDNIIVHELPEIPLPTETIIQGEAIVELPIKIENPIDYEKDEVKRKVARKMEEKYSKRLKSVEVKVNRIYEEIIKGKKLRRATIEVTNIGKHDSRRKGFRAKIDLDSYKIISSWDHSRREQNLPYYYYSKPNERPLKLVPTGRM